MEGTPPMSSSEDETGVKLIIIIIIIIKNVGIVKDELFLQKYTR